MTASFETVRSEMLVALKESFKKNNVEIVSKKYSSSSLPESEKKSIMDHVFREYVITLLENPKEEITVFETYMELCIEGCRRDLCNSTTPVLVMSDMFDTLTLDRCELLFAFVENGVNIWREPCFFGACKNSLLRLCNDLLRRLSRSQNTVFCGRILLFLAKFFPFSERSGLNIVSELNLENITEYGSGVNKDFDGEKEDDASMQADTKIKIDYNLYCKFWALQDFFRNPNQCYNKLKWRAFTSHAGDVLSAFGSFKLEDIQGHSSRKNSAPIDDEMKGKGHVTEQQYFAKFLTNQKLLDLQLSDSNFRRFVLLQFLITFQYLGSTVKFRPETDELKPEQMDWVNESTKLVYSLLAETPPQGKEFAESVRHILKREEYWNAWKNNGCPEFKPPKAMKSEEESAAVPSKSKPTKRLGDIIKSANAHKKFYMGNPELTKLWNISTNNLDACRSNERNFLPSLETYFEEAIQQTDPANMIEESYKRVNDGNFGWRALRLLARRSPHFFIHSNSLIHTLPEYLEAMIKRIAKDLPSMSSDDKGRTSVYGTEDDLQQNSQDAEDDELMPDEKEDEVQKETEVVETAEAEDGDNSNEIQEKPAALTPELIKAVATEVGSEWTKLASKLGYKADEIEYFQSEHSNDFERALHVLKLWSQDDEDASIAGLVYTLTGLGLQSAAEALK